MLVNLADLKFENPAGFLVIDGVNGAGKGTLINAIKEYLESKKTKALFTREPGGSGDFGKSIRNILLSSDEAIDPLAEAFLFVADRAQHVSKVIKPALAGKMPVISDRYYYSTVAFQGYGRERDLNLLKSLNETAIQGIRPDLVILLDLDPQIGLSRNISGQKEQDNFEKPDLDFHNRIRQGFLEQAQNNPEKFLLINAEQNAAGVFNEAKKAIDLWLKALK